MKLMALYLALAVLFVGLSESDPEAARAVFPFVVALALAPALYAEWLRVFRGHDA